MTKTIVISIIFLTFVAWVAFVGFSLLNRNKSNPVVVQNTTIAVSPMPSPSFSPEQVAGSADFKTQQDIAKIAFALQSYYVGHATYPSQAQGIVHLVLDKKLDEVPKPSLYNDAYYYFVYPVGCEGVESSVCNDVYVSGLLFRSGHLNKLWCWDSKSGQARETSLCQP